MSGFKIGKEQLTTERLYSLAHTRRARSVYLDEDVKVKIKTYRTKVENLASSKERIYGINTGFGYLSNISIEEDKMQTLQENLVRSHACGTGTTTEDRITRGLLILRAHTFSFGNSGISPGCVEQILQFINNDILPCIPEKGSVGASGDLAPLSHLALGLMGEGEVTYEGKVRDAGELLKELGIKPFCPRHKEGLSLINGTHYMTTVAAFAIEEAKILAKSADVIGALSLDAIRGTTRAFDPRIQEIRGQEGQKKVAQNFLRLFEEPDEIMDSHSDCESVQDPYSFRCIPQVHGATRDTIQHAENVVNRELNAVTDNPLVFENNDIISGGNFHGQPIAMVMDFLAIATAELGSISERRIEKLTNPNLSNLPAFIIKDSGLNSGYMIPHVVSAALVSENKILCHPASVDSIPTSADKEDHVSMGPIAARKAREINQNVCDILAIELLAACQAIDILEPLKPSRPLKAIYDKVRELSPYMATDRSLHTDIQKVSKWLGQGGILKTLESYDL